MSWNPENEGSELPIFSVKISLAFPTLGIWPISLLASQVAEVLSADNFLSEKWDHCLVIQGLIVRGFGLALTQSLSR